MKKTLAALALTAASVVAVPSAADAATTLDCSTGPVTVRGTGESYTLSGECSTVTIKGSNLRVTLTSADRVVMRSSTSRLSATDAGKLTIVGASNRVALGRADSLTIRGASNRASVGRVPKVAIRGASNKVVVDRGRTKVRVVGAGNQVRVPKK